ncbi:MAG: response regulator [Myxococcales bacterium]|nr:MAG: response regulator [Myxococcales bacterium]
MSRILLIDRDVHVRYLVDQYLRAEGHQIDTADDGFAALDRLTQEPYPLILSEILLPRLDGLALCRRVKAEHPNTRIIILSMLASGGRAQEAGADAFLRKPLVRGALLSTVQTVLTSSTSLSESQP